MRAVQRMTKYDCSSEKSERESSQNFKSTRREEE